MKKNCLMLSFFFILNFAKLPFAGAQTEKNSNFYLNLEPFAGLKNGMINEYVFYPDSIYAESDKLSQLNWELKNSINLGAKLEGGWDIFYINTGFRAAIPGSCGEMTDSDWLNMMASSIKTSPEVCGIENYKTNYSVHDNQLEYDWSYFIFAGTKLTVEESSYSSLKIKPYAGFEFSTFQFIAKNGYLKYGSERKDYSGYYYPWNDDTHQSSQSGTMTGNVISYRRISSIFWAGINTVISDKKHFNLTAGFSFSPYLYCESFDSHLLTHADYADKTDGFFKAYKVNLELETFLSSHFSLILRGEYMWMDPVRGDNYQKSSSQKYYSKTDDAKGGAAESHTQLQAGIKIKIL